MKAMKKEERLKLYLSLSCLVILVILVANLITNYAFKGSVTDLFSAVIDTTVLKITDLRINPASNSANLIWKTEKISTSKIDYGKTLRLGNTEFDSEYTREHVMYLKKLEPSTTYYYKIKSCDIDGNCDSMKTGSLLTLPPSSGDVTPPVISDTALSIYGESAAVIFDTDEAANTFVNYGKDLSLELSVHDSEYAIRHIVNLEKLEPNTKYYYKIRSCDFEFNCESSDMGEFVTKR